MSPDIKEQILLGEEITEWAREYGLEDDQHLTASEAYEMLDDGVRYFLYDQKKQLIKEAEELEVEKKNILEVIESIRRVTNSMYEVGEHLFLRTSEIKSKIRKP